MTWLQALGLEQVPPVHTEWDYRDGIDRTWVVRMEDHPERKPRARSFPRSVHNVFGICVHQTGVKFGTTSSARAKYGLDGALDRRFLGIPYHAVSLWKRDRVLMLSHPKVYSYHGNGANAATVGFAFEGLFPGLEKHRKPKHDKPTGEDIIEMRAHMAQAIAEWRDLGAPIRYMVAHRQYSPDRLADPGELLWKEVALPVAEAMRLKVADYIAVNGGKAIPEEWKR